MPIIEQVTIARDIDAVAALAHEIWNQHFPPIIGQPQVDYMLSELQSASAIARQIQSGGYEYFLMIDDGQPVGYFAIVADEPSRSLQLSKLYVKESHRGRGLGRAALEFIETQCAARGIPELWLTVNRHNADPISFYKRNGFVIAGPIVTDIGNGFVMDDHRMVKRV